MPAKAARVLACPECSSRVTGKEKSCPRCGERFDGATEFDCPFCGGRIERASGICPKCRANLASIANGTAKSAAVSRRCPVCAVVVDHDAIRCRVCGARVDGQQPARATKPCPSCGADVAITAGTCPICEADLRRVVHRIPNAAAKKQISQAPTATRAPRTRTLKARRAPEPPVSFQTHVGNLAKEGVRVRAAPGVGYDEQEHIPSARRADGHRVALRWQLLVILIAVLIIVPTYVYLSYSDEGGKFTIDGNFSDWTDVTTYGSRIPSASSSNNITEWAVAAEYPFLYLYVETQTSMMANANAEGYALFVDSDGVQDTGYAMESIGADYLLYLVGWESAIQFSQVFTRSGTDQYDWNLWSPTGAVSGKMDLTKLEVRAALPIALAVDSKFVLVSKDTFERGSVSYTAPLKGGVLSVHQTVASAVAGTGIALKTRTAQMLTLQFTCDGEGGNVTEVNLESRGAPVSTTIAPFSLRAGETKTFTVSIDTSVASAGQLVSVELQASGITSSFGSIEIEGSGAKAYVEAALANVTVDGAFADWAGKVAMDNDPLRVTAENVNVNEIGRAIDSQNTYFYVSVDGEMCGGAFLPMAIVRPPTTAATLSHALAAKYTAEDILNVYIDGDKSNLTGKVFTIGSRELGVDQMIEVRGVFGRVTSMAMYDYNAEYGSWTPVPDLVTVAKDDSRIEIAVRSDSLRGAADIDFIVETTAWNGAGDFASINPGSSGASALALIGTVVNEAGDSVALQTPSSQPMLSDQKYYLLSG